MKLNTMNKTYLILIAALLVLGAWFWLRPQSAVSPDGGNADTGGSTADIAAELDGIRVNDPDFGSIDGDLNSL